MMVVPKQMGRVRICTDHDELNKSVWRKKHPLPSVELTLGQLADSWLDANAGFWQIPLSKESSLLTNFITLFGWICYNWLCFGISSAPEHFQKRMSRILEGLKSVLCQMDDVFIWGAKQKEHDERLQKTLSRLQEAGVTLNYKFELSKSRIKFLGQVIKASGLSEDPDKGSTVKAMTEPRNVSEVRCFLRMMNPLGNSYLTWQEKAILSEIYWKSQICGFGGRNTNRPSIAAKRN